MFVKRSLNVEETGDLIRGYDLLDEAAVKNARQSGDWQDEDAPYTSVCVGPEECGWDDVVVAQWSTDYGVEPRMAHMIIRGPTGHSKTSLLPASKEGGNALVVEEYGLRIPQLLENY